jgi:hypothetical protein
MADTLNFSGHETFHCRSFWLKKGYDHVKHGRTFTDPDAVVHLGVGKNMVTSIRFWLRAFDMADESTQLTELGKRLLDDEGWDPYLEDVGSLWLLHYKLVTRKHASIYHIIFRELRDRLPEFNAQSLADHVLAEKQKGNAGTLEKDFSVFVRNYLQRASADVDDFAGLLSELELVREIKLEATEGATRKDRTVYFIDRTKRLSLPPRILLFAILESIPDQMSISLNTLMDGEESLGKVFALHRDGMYELLEDIAKLYNGITISREAGVVELQFTNRPDQWAVLADHYAN